MKRRQLLKNSATTLAGLGTLPAISVLLKSCGVRRPSEYQPIYLSTEQFDTVWQMAELILPKTDSPGSSDAGVAPYIDLLFDSYFEVEKRAELELGLNTFMTEVQEKYQKTFLEMDEAGQIAYMQLVEAASGKKSFFKSFKGLVLWAFFTSEVGMKSMNYKPVPGKYDGCITIDSNEKLLVGNR